MRRNRQTNETIASTLQGAVCPTLKEFRFAQSRQAVFVNQETMVRIIITLASRILHRVNIRTVDTNIRQTDIRQVNRGIIIAHRMVETYLNSLTGIRRQVNNHLLEGAIVLRQVYLLQRLIGLSAVFRYHDAEIYRLHLIVVSIIRIVERAAIYSCPREVEGQLRAFIRLYCRQNEPLVVSTLRRGQILLEAVRHQVCLAAEILIQIALVGHSELVFIVGIVVARRLFRQSLQHFGSGLTLPVERVERDGGAQLLPTVGQGEVDIGTGFVHQRVAVDGQRHRVDTTVGGELHLLRPCALFIAFAEGTHSERVGLTLLQAGERVRLFAYGQRIAVASNLPLRLGTGQPVDYHRGLSDIGNLYLHRRDARRQLLYRDILDIGSVGYIALDSNIATAALVQVKEFLHRLQYIRITLAAGQRQCVTCLHYHHGLKCLGIPRVGHHADGIDWRIETIESRHGDT